MFFARLWNLQDVWFMIISVHQKSVSGLPHSQHSLLVARAVGFVPWSDSSDHLGFCQSQVLFVGHFPPTILV